MFNKFPARPNGLRVKKQARERKRERERERERESLDNMYFDD